MVCDDYGFASCPGARKAVDEYFSGRPDVPIELPSGQAPDISHRLTRCFHRCRHLQDCGPSLDARDADGDAVRQT